jgi:DNA (cytosine-5)-methyltransferase 1
VFIGIEERRIILKKYKFIDLFAGIGGFRIAFEAADAECVFSNEIDKFACQTYEANFGENPLGDITKIEAEKIPEHNILAGGFPCQPFSIAGVSKYKSLGIEHGFKNKTKGTLFFDIARIIEHHKPEAFLLENVKNLKSHRKGKTWETIESVLRDELNYNVYSKVLDAANLVPQHRERVFIVGFKNLKDYEFPIVNNEKPKFKDIMEKNVDEKYTLTDHQWNYHQNYKEKQKAKGNGFGYGLVDLDGVSRTLSARYYKDGSEIFIPQKGKNPRRLTPRECARLQGYPDTFEIPVSNTQAYKQFGNSVAVPLVKIMAKSVVDALKNNPENK